MGAGLKLGEEQGEPAFTIEARSLVRLESTTPMPGLEHVGRVIRRNKSTALTFLTLNVFIAPAVGSDKISSPPDRKTSED